LRHWREELTEGKTLDAWWQVYGRNKRSVAMELRDPQAMEVLRELLASAQVLIESFRSRHRWRPWAWLRRRCTPSIPSW
jgi:crotonobetainyl-CoA:carnitine CoA-transferase CaiB-like acyl-CoA transferase